MLTSEGMNTQKVPTFKHGGQDLWSYHSPYYRVLDLKSVIAADEQAGMGVAGAIGAKLALPDKKVVCITGDGAFQMHYQESPTAVQYGAPVTWMVLDKRSLGWIRFGQNRRSPDVQKRSEDLCYELRNGFFLSSMMGITDGDFCSQRSEGCVMVQLGAYRAEPAASAEAKGPDARSFLPDDPQACTDFLAEECRKAKRFSEVFTCLNLATPKLEWGLEAAESFSQAGGDLLELNVHGGYRRYLEQGKLRAMVLPENQGELFRWVGAFTELEIPLIVKFHGQYSRQSLLQVLGEMTDLAILGVHLNVRAETTRKPDIDFAQTARRRYPGFLLVSGYVRSAADAWALFEVGADMVGIAEPAREDPECVHRIAQTFKAEYEQEQDLQG